MPQLLTRTTTPTSGLGSIGRSPANPQSAPIPPADTRRYRRMMTALLAAGVATFAELYAVQGVLPQLAADLRVPAAAASLSVSAATLGLALGVLPWAWAADRIGRLRAMQVSVGGAVVLGTLAVVAPSLELLLALRFLAGAALGGVPVLAVAYVHEELTGRRAAAAAAAYISGTTIGGAAGRLVAGPLAPWLGWRGALLVVGACGVVAAVLFTALAPVPTRQQRSCRPQLPRLREALADPALRHLFLAAPLVTGGFVGVLNFLQFRLTAAPFGLAPGLVALVFLAYGAGTLSSRWAGSLLPRHGFRSVAGAGLGAMALGTLAMLPDRLGLVIAGLVVFSGGFFVVHAAAVATTGALAAPDVRGQAGALYTIGFYVGSGLIGALVGLAFDASGWVPFSGCILALVLGGAVVVATMPVPARRDR